MPAKPPIKPATKAREAPSKSPARPAAKPRTSAKPLRRPASGDIAPSRKPAGIKNFVVKDRSAAARDSKIEAIQDISRPCQARRRRQAGAGAQGRAWIESVASSLTVLFSPSLMTVRIAAFEEHYPWVAAEGLTYFRSRPRRATDDAPHATELVLAHCTTAELQARAVAALDFKCDLLWAQLDAIYAHCVGR